MKVCNVCSAKWHDGENCPQCLAVGRGEIRDYHYSFDEPPPEPEAVDTESTAAGGAPAAEEETEPEIPSDEDEPEEDLTGMSRNQLSSLAAERGHDASGTKADLLNRLQPGAQE